MTTPVSTGPRQCQLGLGSVRGREARAIGPASQVVWRAPRSRSFGAHLARRSFGAHLGGGPVPGRQERAIGVALLTLDAGLAGGELVDASPAR